MKLSHLLRPLRSLWLLLLPLLAAVSLTLREDGSLIILVPNLGLIFPAIRSVLPVVADWLPLAGLIYEALARALPTLRDYSLFNLLGRILDWLAPNLSVSGAWHKTVVNYAL